MMIPVEFVPANAPLKGKGKEVLDPTSTPVPLVKLQGAAKNQLASLDLRNRSRILVFFQGAECAHCTQELRDLIANARGVLDKGIEIMAVSSRKIHDLDRALATLDVRAADSFRLIVDEGHDVFRAFGCYERGPRHGLFLIDQRGMIRAAYTGDSPFGDSREAIRRAMALGGRNK